MLPGVGGRTVSQESVRLTCIVDHPEFSTVCLNPLVLRVALAGTVAMRGERIPLPLERNPFVVLVAVLKQPLTAQKTPICKTQ